MTKTATINMRVSPEVKQEAESIFSVFGLSITEAINIFLHKSILEGGIPFELKQPKYNAETEAAITEAREIIAGKVSAERFDSVEDAFSFLDDDE